MRSGIVSITACLRCALVAALALAAAPSHFARPHTARQAGGPQAQAAQKGAAGSGASGIVVEPNQDYRVGARDVIEVAIEDAPELSGKFEVNSRGTFTMQFLGRVTAKGKTVEELATFIADGLRGRYLKAPRVSVTVAQHNSRTFFIQGAVRQPGPYRIESRPSLLKIISVAGGLAENHGSTAFIIREAGAGEDDRPENDQGGDPGAGHAAAEGTRYELLRVNISGLLKGRLDQNIFIEPGDVINIPPMDVFFVAGEVNAPGSFPLKEGTTLRQAISLAQGMTFEAAKDRGIIFREDDDGKRQEIQVNVGAVMSGKRDDVEIKANDVIIIAGSRFKSVGGTLLRALGMGTLQRGVPVR
jgi:polysaccharide export outer membrane protein